MLILLAMILSVVAAVVIGLALWISRCSGSLPRGERLCRIMQSPNWRDGEFRNLDPTPQMTPQKGLVATMYDFLFHKPQNLRPHDEIPNIKTDLHTLDCNEECYIWFGHSSYLIQSGGMRFLVDPVLTNRLPMSAVMKPFRGSDAFTPDDMPDIDVLIITHDHWDHLDYHTVLRLRERIGRVVCPLGVGSHFEYWGFAPERITELDWDESFAVADGIAIHALPARHFSGRGLKRNRTLWASYMLQTPVRNIFLSGDGGYGSHFAAIGQQFPHIDLAIIENGQYNADWRYIHLMPDLFARAIADLHPKYAVTVHNSKFALARHPWNEPMINAATAAERTGFTLLTPRIGEKLPLDRPTPTAHWWQGLR